MLAGAERGIRCDRAVACAGVTSVHADVRLRSSGYCRSRSGPAGPMAREINLGSAHARGGCRGAREDRGRQNRVSQTSHLLSGEIKTCGVFVESGTPSRLTKKPATECPARASCKSCDIAFMKVICPTCQWTLFELTAHIDERRPVGTHYLLDQAADQSSRRHLVDRWHGQERICRINPSDRREQAWQTARWRRGCWKEAILEGCPAHTRT